MAVQFSKSAEKEFTKIVGRYPKKDAALLPVLWLAQKEFGYLSPEVQKYVAEKMGVSLARVESVVSFYTLYRTKPAGKFHIQVCRNISCNLRGCESLISALEQELGIKSGETTPDGLFSYEQVECLAACGGAPALQVNSKYHERVSADTLRNLIETCRKSPESV
jgi:NADH-quinone oxidoreductase subunit E